MVRPLAVVIGARTTAAVADVIVNPLICVIAGDPPEPTLPEAGSGCLITTRGTSLPSCSIDIEDRKQSALEQAVPVPPQSAGTSHGIPHDQLIPE